MDMSGSAVVMKCWGKEWFVIFCSDKIEIYRRNVSA